MEADAAVERAPPKPDHDAYPSLPGTPEPHISEFEVKQPKRQSTPPDQLMSKRAKEVTLGFPEEPNPFEYIHYGRLRIF